MPHIIPSSGGRAEAHQLFQLTAVNNGKVPVSTNVEFDLNFDLNLLWVTVSKVGVHITQECKEFLDDHHKTKLPGVIGWILINLAY